MIAPLRRLAHSGGLVAAAFALKYPLIALPNVEPLTLAFFSVGYAYGPLWGLFVGILGEGIFATFHPLGMPIAPVWAAQVISMGVAGALGGITGRICEAMGKRQLGRIGAAVAGIAATLVFDILTNLAFAVSIGPFWVIMAAGVPFAAIHIGSNALLFAAIFPILNRWLLHPASSVVEPSAS